MTFLIRKTSIWNNTPWYEADTVQPCEEAREDIYTDVDWDGSVVRTRRWLMDFDTMDDLMEFVKKHGDVVVQKGNVCTEMIPVIEIYDTWRE